MMGYNIRHRVRKGGDPGPYCRDLNVIVPTGRSKSYVALGPVAIRAPAGPVSAHLLHRKVTPRSSVSYPVYHRIVRWRGTHFSSPFTT